MYLAATAKQKNSSKVALCRAVLWWHSIGLCTVIMTEYGKEGQDGLLSTTARCALKADPMELPDALKGPDASSDEAPALSELFTRLAVPAGVQAGQVVDHLCRCSPQLSENNIMMHIAFKVHASTYESVKGNGPQAVAELHALIASQPDVVCQLLQFSRDCIFKPTHALI